MTNSWTGSGPAAVSEGAVAYIVRMTPSVRAYLWNFSGLTRQGRLSLAIGTLGLLRNHGDALRSDPSRRLASGSPYFYFDHLFADAGRFWLAECVADDSAAAYGILEIVYLNCKYGP
jgi:hypothetical protein